MSYASSAAPKATRRKLDPKRPITVYRAGEVSDADAQPVSLDLATGVEKEEEKEVHLQAYIQTYASTAATVDIPVPDATQTISEDEYLKLYPPRPATGAGASGSAGSSGRSTPSASRPPSRTGSTSAMGGTTAGGPGVAYTTSLPTTMIRFSTALEDLPCGNAYNLDEQDDAWLASFRATYAAEYPTIVAELYPGSGSSSTATESAVTSSGGQDGSPPRKRARRGTSASPNKATSKDDQSAAGTQKPPPLVPLSDEAFEVVMHVLESAMNDQVSWMLTNPGYDTELAMAERITVAEALAALRSRPDLVGPQPLGGMSASSSYPLASNSILGTPRHAASTLTYPSLANTPMTRTSDLPGMPSSSSKSSFSHSNSHFSPSNSSAPPKALPPYPTDPPASQVEWWLPRVHPWWSERRARCKNRPIAPLVRIEEPVSKNEADPYVCFRRREVKVVRKTRRSDVTALASLKKLRGELASARVLVGLVHDREVACLDKVRVDRAVFNARVKLRAVKKQAAGVASATGLPEAEMELPEFALPIVPPLPPALQGAVKSVQAQKAAAAGGSVSASSTPLIHSIPLPGASTAAAASSSASSSRKRDHHHHHHHHSSSSARATPSATPSGPSALSRSASASALSAATEGPVQVGPRPFTMPKVLSVDIKGMPSVGEVQQAKIEREIKDRLTASAQGVDVSQAPQAIFHPLPPVRVPGGSGGKSVPTSSAAAADAQQQQQQPVPTMAIPPLAWRAFTPRLPPSYMSPAGTYHGFSHQHHAAATSAAAAAAATSGGKASPYQSMFISAMANGMYHPGLASAAAAARGIAPGSTYHPHAPVTPPGTPPMAGFMSGQHPPNHPHLNPHAPGAWLAHVPPDIRRQLLYPYAAAAAAAAAAASMAAANANANASGLDQSTFKHVPHRLRHPRVEGGLDVASSNSSSSSSSSVQEPSPAAKDRDGDTIMSDTQPSSAAASSSSRPSTALSHPGAMSTPSPSPDIVAAPSASRSPHASPSDVRSQGMPSSDGPAPPSPSSSPTCLPASSPPEASLKSVPSLGPPARADARTGSLELSQRQQQHHPIPLSPASVASEPTSHGPPPPTNISGEPASPLPASTKAAPWLSVPPAKVFASLFDRDSPMSAQLVTSAMSKAISGGEDKMDVYDVERTPTQATVNVNKLADPLIPASPTPLPPQGSQWAFRRRVGRVGRAVVERRWVPPAGASGMGGKMGGPAAAAGKRHPSAR